MVRREYLSFELVYLTWWLRLSNIVCSYKFLSVFFVCFCFFLCVCFRSFRSEENRSLVTSECTTKSISLKFSGSNQVLKWSIVAFYDQVILNIIPLNWELKMLLLFFLIVADKFTVLSFLEALEDSVSKTSELESSRGDDKDSRSQTCNQNDPMDEGK